MTINPASNHSEEPNPQAQTPTDSAEGKASPQPGDLRAEPQDTVVTKSGSSTIPLPELGGQLLAVLPEGTMVNDRYEVVTLLSNRRDVNSYRVIDRQGYRRCWACGSSGSMPGDTYCVECGAQLTGRYYRLQEFSTSVDQAGQSVLPPIPFIILDNELPSIAHVYDTFQSPETERAYVVWEEVYGRPLSSWLPGAPLPEVTAGMGGIQSGHLAIAEEPSEEQCLSWMTQAAELLEKLHKEGLSGCNLELDNLLVQPGDRLVMIDPSACRETSSKEGKPEQAPQATEVRNLAGQLEEWFLAVRKEDSVAVMSTESRPLNGNALMVGADEVTGPLGTALNPARLLSKAKEGAYPEAESFAAALRELYESSKPLNNLLLWSGRATNLGRVRKINEDSLLTLEGTVLEHEGNLPVALFVIADGMGGHQSGEVASAIAARTIGGMVNTALLGPLLSGDPVAHDVRTCTYLLRQAVLEANRRIAGLAQERQSDLGTTTVAVLMVGNQVSIANAGDSRTYLWHDKELTPITRDHSLVAQLVAAGQLAPDEIYTHPRRNEIYRALGDARLGEADIDVFVRRLQPGDALLLCSDGLWDFVRDPAIAAIIEANDDPQVICDELIKQANEQGGEDNISAIFVRVMTTQG